MQDRVRQALLAMQQQGGQRPMPQAVPPNRMTSGSVGQPVADPMQGIGQVAQAAAGAFRDQRMAGRDPKFPTAPLGLGQPGGLFGLLSNPMATYSKGGGLY